MSQRFLISWQAEALDEEMAITSKMYWPTQEKLMFKLMKPMFKENFG